MRDTIHTSELKVGMYVVIPSSWIKLPFLSREFMITSQEQITKIIEFGLATIMIDTEKSAALQSAPSVAENQATTTAPRTWEPDKLIPP